jgi:RHS repeat-associated protein
LAEFTYDASSKRQPKTVKDAAGQITTFTYNSYGQTLTVTNPKSETMTFTYDRDDDSDTVSDGFLKWTDEALANTRTTFGYDGYGRLETITNRESDTVSYEYEQIGGDPTRTLNRVTAVNFPDGTSVKTGFHRLDTAWTKSRDGRLTYMFHTPLRQLDVVYAPNGDTVRYQWCKCGSLAAIIDESGNLTRWNRDTLGRPTSKVFTDNRSIQYGYQPHSGRLASITDARGQVTNYTYYVDGALSSVTYTNAVIDTPTVTFTREAAYGRVATMTDGVGMTTYGYHPITSAPILGAGALATVDGPWTNDTISYTYDELGRSLTREINGFANSSSVVYDSLGRITSATTLQGTTTMAYVGTTGRLDYVDLPNTQRTDFDYHPGQAVAGTGDGNRRLKQIKNLGVGASGTGSVLSKFDYNYTVDGMIKTWTQQQSGNPQTWSLGNDRLDRLTSAVIRTGTGTLISEHHFAYDAGGNRTLEQTGQSPVSASFNSVNQLSSQAAGGSFALTGTINEAATLKVAGEAVPVDSAGNFSAVTPVSVGSNAIELRAKDVAGNETVKTINVNVAAGTSRAFTYDENGNQISATGYTGLPGGDRTYEWDAADRLAVINYTGTNKKTKFTYDGASRWVKIVEDDNGVITSEKRFIWEGMSIAEERDASNAVTKRHFAQGFQIGVTDYYVTRDHLGSVREISDASGGTRAVYNYGLWGKRTPNAVTTSPVESDFGFTGHYEHSGSGLVLAPYRAYDPVTGRWLNRDPIGESGGLNLYGYASNMPVQLGDSLGLTEARGVNMGERSIIKIRSQSGATAKLSVTGRDDLRVKLGFEEGIYNARAGTQTINYLEIVGHGGLLGREYLEVSDTVNLIRELMSKGSNVYLNGCHTCELAKELSKEIPDVTFTGNAEAVKALPPPLHSYTRPCDGRPKIKAAYKDGRQVIVP